MKMVDGRIITKMRLFYKDVVLSIMVLDEVTNEIKPGGTYIGSVFTGIQFKDHEN